MWYDWRMVTAIVAFERLVRAYVAQGSGLPSSMVRPATNGHHARWNLMQLCSQLPTGGAGTLSPDTLPTPKIPPAYPTGAVISRFSSTALAQATVPALLHLG